MGSGGSTFNKRNDKFIEIKEDNVITVKVLQCNKNVYDINDNLSDYGLHYLHKVSPLVSFYKMKNQEVQRNYYQNLYILHTIHMIRIIYQDQTLKNISY
mmetsp:Transcript_13858/g.12564  ORF Transcript_13858/g.12564 Transcript_13858/m.12564 type:complete len:99 (+) Transcript_13858:70-366(+)